MNKSLLLTLICLLPTHVSAKEMQVKEEKTMEKILNKKDFIMALLVLTTGVGGGYLVLENRDLKNENIKVKADKYQANSIIKNLASVFVKVNEIRREFNVLDESFDRIKDHSKDEKMDGLDGEIVFRSMASRDLEDFEKKFANFSAIMNKSPHSLEDLNNNE